MSALRPVAGHSDDHCRVCAQQLIICCYLLQWLKPEEKQAEAPCGMPPGLGWPPDQSEPRARRIAASRSQWWHCALMCVQKALSELSLPRG